MGGTQKCALAAVKLPRGGLPARCGGLGPQRQRGAASSDAGSLYLVKVSLEIKRVVDSSPDPFVI